MTYHDENQIGGGDRPALELSPEAIEALIGAVERGLRGYNRKFELERDAAERIVREGLAI